jgi:hypothetical protein
VLAHGFDSDMIGGLVRAKLATARREIVKAGAAVAPRAELFRARQLSPSICAGLCAGLVSMFIESSAMMRHLDVPGC